MARKPRCKDFVRLLIIMATASIGGCPPNDSQDNSSGGSQDNSSGGSQDNSSDGSQDPAWVVELRDDVAGKLGIKFESDVIYGQAENLQGVRSNEIVLSRRTDSLTYFIRDSRWGVARAHGVYEGPDPTILDQAMKIAAAFAVRASEIDEAKVLQVRSAVGSVDQAVGTVEIEETVLGERFVYLSRRVDRLPIFSSRAMVSLDRDGQIGFLEFHWPVIPPEVLSTASEMARVVEAGWAAPELPEAQVESMEAGILHSPAAAFVMDIAPVIRVVYAPVRGGLGKKAVRYFGLDGQLVPPPRQFKEIKEWAEDAGRREGSVE
jgi:hypothetical protein